MKCKAKWNKTMREWQIYCPEHDTSYVHVAYNGPTTLPHDVAMIHINREHRR